MSGAGSRKVLKAIETFSKFLITTHVNPEGDAIGSQISLGHLLSGMGKTVYLVNEDAVPEEYRFLPGIELVSTDLLEAPRDFEAACVLDAPDRSRIGKVSKLLTKDKFIINIDHHPSNENFGAVNWVDPQASATGEMIYRLYKAMEVPLDEIAAKGIYTAIMADTGSFKYSNTTSETHLIASELLKFDLDINKIYEEVFENYSLASRRLLALALETLATSDDGRIAYLEVTKEMLSRTNALPEDTEGFIEMARSIRGVEVALLFKETRGQNEVKVSLRSKGGVDVNAISQGFGGGGHKTAAGCVMRGSMEEVKKRVLVKIAEALG